MHPGSQRQVSGDVHGPQTHPGERTVSHQQGWVEREQGRQDQWQSQSQSSHRRLVVQTKQAPQGLRLGHNVLSGCKEVPIDARCRFRNHGVRWHIRDKEKLANSRFCVHACQKRHQNIEDGY